MEKRNPAVMGMVVGLLSLVFVIVGGVFSAPCTVGCLAIVGAATDDKTPIYWGLAVVGVVVFVVGYVSGSNGAIRRNAMIDEAARWEPCPHCKMPTLKEAKVCGHCAREKQGHA